MSDWGEVLKKAGYPSTAIVLDFETYYDSDYSFKKMSTVEYVMDKRFEILGLGIARSPDFLAGFYLQKLEGVPLISTILRCYQNEHGENFEGATIVCQNCFFDCLILQEHFGITPRYTVDIKDLDRIWDAQEKHSLEVMAKRWKTPKPKGDTKQFKSYRWANMSPEMRENLAEYCKTDVEIESFLFQKLLPLVPNPEIELPLATQTLQLFLKPQILIDKELGQNLKKKMRMEMLKPRLELRKLGIKAGRKTISGNKKFVVLLNQYVDVPLKSGKKGVIPALAKDDEGLRQLLNHPKLEVQLLAKARQSIKSWPLHIARVDNLINQARCRNGLIGAPLSFYAAHTGRWGGTEGINLQNMGGRGRGGSGTHPLIQQTRTMLQAPDGYILGIVDYKQIEARVLAWLAGQDDLVRGFANGEDIYSEFMRTSFGWYVREVIKTDPPPVARVLKTKRGFGKDAILGCGYGMGTLKFYERCRANNDLRPMIDSGQYGFDFIDKLIKTYRQKYSKIPAFWSNVEKAWRFVTKYPSEITQISGPISFFNKGGATYIILPSGRYLRYPHARVKQDGKLSYRWSANIWGGHLTENIVQAVARDIMGEALLKLQDVVLHVHDEIICLFKKSEAEQRLKEMMEIVSIVPKWVSGLPVSVEGELSEVYKK